MLDSSISALRYRNVLVPVFAMRIVCEIIHRDPSNIAVSKALRASLGDLILPKEKIFAVHSIVRETLQLEYMNDHQCELLTEDEYSELDTYLANWDHKTDLNELSTELLHLLVRAYLFHTPAELLEILEEISAYYNAHTLWVISTMFGKVKAYLAFQYLQRRPPVVSQGT
jgi:hypothetical protein